MKKNILFIIPSLGVGGGEKSLVNLLSEFNYKKYNIDLFLMDSNGLFMNLLPKEINILENSETLIMFKQKLFNSMVSFLKKGNFKLAYYRLRYSIKNRKSNSVSKNEQYSWLYLREAIGNIEKKYDVAIGYLEKTSNYMCVDCVQAHKKIGWIHTDIRKLDLDESFEYKYLKQMDQVVTISETCAEILKSRFKDIANKIKVIKNIVSPNIIYEMANEDIKLKKATYIIVSVGRLSYEKGFDLAIKACKELMDEGIDVAWYLIGDGEERKHLENMIKENELTNNFILVGTDSNPYKYIKKADVYVQPSRFEGKSIAIDEAIILKKQIVVTNFSTVNDQIENGVTGIITEMNGISIAREIKKLLGESKINEALDGSIDQYKIISKNELNKLYKFIK